MATRFTPGSGAILKPFFNSSYGIEKIEVVEGGSGYASTDPPKITVDGTQTPTVEGVFYPVISGVGTISEIVIFSAGAGYFPVFSTTTSGQAFIDRGVFGTVAAAHTVGTSSVFTGDFNIVDDEIFFAAPPYGKQGPAGLETGSTFSGRMFSRKLDPYQTKDYNVIFDDISLDFTGVAGTQFSLTSNLNDVTSAYNNVNAGSDIGNNPFVLINNVIQTPGLDFEVTDSISNDINFLSGVPRAGRLIRVGLTTGSGYYYPLAASGKVGIGSTGTVSVIQLTGGGQGYRNVPDVRIRSAEGSGAIATAYLGVNTTTTYSISTATYNEVVGIMTFTTSSSHDYQVGDRIRLVGAGITVVQNLPARNITTFAYTYTTGIATITVDSGHYIGTGSNQSRHLLVEGISVIDGASNTVTFREDGYPIVSIASTQVVEIQAGIGTTSYTYDSGGTVKTGIDTNILEGRNLVGFDLIGVTTDTFTAFVGITTHAHNYVSGGTATKAHAGIITGLAIVDPGANYFIPKTISFIDYEPSNGVTTITAVGDAIGIVTTIANVYYTDTTGIATIQGTNLHGLSVGDVVKLIGIGFSTPTGDLEYPLRQPYYEVKSTPSTIDFTVNLGISTLGVHTHQQLTGTFQTYAPHGVKTDDFVVAAGAAMTTNYWPELNIYDAVYDGASGIITVTTTTPHNLSERDFVIMSGIAMTCNYDGGVGILTFPRVTDPYYNGSQVDTVGTSTIFSSFVGTSTITQYSYDGSGTVQHVYRYPLPYLDAYGLASEQFGDGQYVLEKLDNANFRVQSGLVTSRWMYSRGGTVEKPIYLEISEPIGYFNLPLIYNENAVGYTTSGIGTNATADVAVNVDGEIGVFDVKEEGVGFKVDDALTIAGLSTDPRVGVLTEFQLNVIEIGNDKFFGFYPGQFVLFDDISEFFNGQRKKFTLSVTTAGVTEILSLKTVEGSDMDVTNNIFIYINDILQTPGEAYTWKGSRVLFTEAPKEGSKCSVFYYRGSSIDVEEIEPPATIKPGDIIQIKENKLDVLDRDQFERMTKRIVASDVLETFTYDSLGINTSQDAERPLSWEKQKSDKIISGVYYSKNRLNYRSKISPVTRIINNVGQTDDSIYVQNAFPTFSEIDLLTEEDRHIEIFEEREIEPAIITTVVSTSSSISNLSIASSGVGYLNVTNPEISISGAKVTRKDPMVDWKFDVITGEIYSSNLQAITQYEPIIAVGSSSQYINTLSGFFWERGNIGFGGTITFNAIDVGVEGSNYRTIAVGEYASAATAVAYGDTVGPWTELNLIEQRQIPSIGLSVDYPTTFSREFNDVMWDPTAGSWVAIGFGGSIFTGVGIGTTTLYSQYSGTPQTLHGITYAQNEYIVVGNGGAILASNKGKIWGLKTSNTLKNLKDIIYDGSRFVAVGDQGTIVTSTDKNFWFPFSENLPAGTTSPATFDFDKLRYKDGIYVGISTLGEIYYSLDLANWNYRYSGQSQPVGDLVFSDFGLEGRLIVVGSSGTAYYAEPIFNRATATCAVTNGGVSTAVIINGGFGYEYDTNPPVVVQTDTPKRETVYSFKTVGDFGTIVGMNTFVTGIGFSVPPKLEFYLKSEFNDNTNLGYGFSSLNTFGINNSQLQIGDYFVIYDSPVVVGHALTGISTHVGGYNNYPTNKVGIISEGENLNGLFRVDDVTVADVVSGIVTVTCSFLPGPNSNSQIQVGIGTTAISDYYGKYSWGKIYDFQNRISGNPENFFVNVDAGLVGLSTAAQISRTKPLT